MKCTKWLITLGVLVVALAIPAKADADDPIQGYMAGGYSQPLGAADDALTGGWNLSGGMIWHPAPSRPFGVRVDLGFNAWDATNQAIENLPPAGFGVGLGAATVDGGYATMWSLTTDALWQFGQPDHVGGYVGLGIGGYRRYAALTNDVTTLGYICDPYWGYCYYGTVYGSQTVADDTLTKFGYNASVGLTFPVGNGTMYLEARYHYIVSTQLQEYMPIVLGYRF